jgi:hypothetical protein
MTGKTPSADSRIPRGPHADSSPFALARRPPSVPKRERPAELWPPLAAASGRPVAGSASGALFPLIPRRARLVAAVCDACVLGSSWPPYLCGLAHGRLLSWLI